MPRKKSALFNLPKRPTNKPSTPPPALTFDLYDHESAYVVVAILDAQRQAAAMQASCEAAGHVKQSLVFAQKAAALQSIAERIAKAFTSRQR